MRQNQIRNYNNTLDLEYIIRIVTKKWYVFGGAVFIALIFAFAINKFKTPIYEVKSSILINEESNSTPGSSVQLLQDLGIQGGDRNFANEMLVLKSYPLMERAIGQLDFRISYFDEGFFQTKELYKASPFLVVINQDHPQPVNLKFDLKFEMDGTVTIKADGQNVSIYSFLTKETTQIIENLSIEEKSHIDETIKQDNFMFKIFVNDNFEIEELSNQNFSFVIHSDKGLIKSYQTKLTVQPPDLESTVAQLSIKTSVPEKAIDFLRELTKIYLEKDISQKQHTSQKTIEYINNQLSIVKDSLELAEENLQRFRSNNQVLDLSMQSQQVYSELRELENQKAQIEVKQKYFDYIKNEFDNDDQEYSDLITPSAMGINDPMINNLIEELITLNSERNSFIENNQEKSPYLRRINIRIDNLHNMISENINYIEQANKIDYQELNSRINQLNRSIRELPQTQRKLVGIERKFNVNDAIYTYLLEKKAEAEIAKASFQADAEIVEPPDINGYDPISPKKKVNYLLFFILGLAIPFIYFRTFDLIRKTVDEPEHFEKITDFPLLGKIYHNNKETEAVVRGFPKSHIAESFRKIVLNMGYFNQNNSGKIVMISSTISGEGKSFVSLNLAYTLADNGYKCILVGYDIRKPRDYSTLANNVGVGLSSYLSNQCSIEDIIVHTDKNNLDCILAGKTPPNPFELVASAKTDDLITLLRENYDYVILDTPPIGVVSEGYLLLSKADLNVFIVRLKRTLKKELATIVKELADKNIKSSMIINDIPLTKSKKYGYGYYIDN